MKLTLPMTFEIDDNHPMVRDAVDQAAAKLAQQEAEQAEAPRCCPQCDEPLTEDVVSPLGPDYDPMCEDCELEHVNPAEWARRHQGGK